jgi:H+/Na+-translocating ferredoxin:NAD+ oxidoreductase subunit G
METGPAGAGKGFQNSFLAQAWLVLVLAISFGSALAFVQIQLSGVIAANKLNETMTQVPALVWGDKSAEFMADATAPVQIVPGSLRIEKGEKATSYPLFKVTRSGELAGWVIRAGGQGYADRIEALIGLDPHAETITGLFILEQKETPGLGNKIIFPEWRGQFTGKKTASPLTVVKGGAVSPRTIDAVTGATISSRSVTWIVNQTVTDVRGRLTPESVRLQTGGGQ